MPVSQPWGRFASLGLAAFALLASQTVALAALVWWYGVPFVRLPEVGGDGIAVSITILVSTPTELVLLALFAQRTGARTADYMAWTLPRRADVTVGMLAVIAFVALADFVSWAAGRNVITSFQNDIYTTAAAQGWLARFWFAVIVVTPIGEESIFRGFLFRGWYREPQDAWTAIALTSVLFALLHVQYDWFVIAQVFGFGLLLGWMRWVSGSTLLTMLLHALINLEGMIETAFAVGR
jgi:membrane protease YdiL (CAAX protease family)